MPKILVWKCSHTGKLFEDEKKYRAHLSKLARKRRERRKIQIEKNAAQAWWTEFQNREMDIRDLAEVIIQEQDRFWAEAAKSFGFGWDQIGKKHKGVIMPVPELTEFTRFDLRWYDRVSNTHNCPKNGKTNWWCKDHLPRGYPGWSGQIAWRIKWPKECEGWYPGSDLFRGTRVCIHTSSGGGGNWKDGYQNFEYGVYIFAEDWPGMARFHDKKFVWQSLGGNEFRSRTNHETNILQEAG